MNEETYSKIMYVCESFETLSDTLSKMKYFMSIESKDMFFYQFGKLSCMMDELDDRCNEIIQEINEE